MTLETPLAGSHRPTFYSSKGVAAIAAGEIPLARAYHRAAAAALTGEMNATHPAKDRHPLRFQVATQLFKAGDYEKAKRLAAQVDPDHLSPSLRPVFRQFRLDCEYRASRNYEAGIRRALLASYQASAWQQCLDLLAAHPHVLAPEGVAFVRAIAFEHLGKYRSAARWSAKAYRLGVTSSVVGESGAYQLAMDDRLDEATEYVQYLIDALPQAFTFAVASFVCHRCLHKPGIGADERAGYAKRQVEYLNEARRRFQELPLDVRQKSHVRAYLALVMVAAAETFQLVGLPDGAKALLEEARPLDPPFVASATREFAKHPVQSRPSEEPLDIAPRGGGSRVALTESTPEGEEYRIDFRRVGFAAAVPPSRVPNGGLTPIYPRDHFVKAYVADSGRKKATPGVITAGATEA